MIELKNLSKTYKSKKSTNTVALKDISIKFPERGMVFILGKSGSGKSTLLNVIGGLDKYDSGEITINGRSTKTFKGRDYDAFRNTYMGFIFQEFNLIEDYSVEQNIKLAIELQHKEATEEEIEKILEKVELTEISKRKTNELSGGQKQRIAIARAIIKNPEIILADEPTGNLDSQTGEQIWGILKELSKEKLVIVVSHDKESANKYADRIIEIQDGIIIKDEGKTEDLVSQKEFYLKKASLPFKHSINLGFKSMLTKKISLFFSSLIIATSFIFLAIALSTTWTNINERIIEQVKENDEFSVNISYFNDIVSDKSPTGFSIERGMKELTDKEIEDIENNTNLQWRKKYNIGSLEGQTFKFLNLDDSNNNNIPVYYSLNSDLKIEYIEINEFDKLNNLLGRIPIDENEIIISNYMADCIIYSGVQVKNETAIEEYKPKDYNEIINSNKYLKFGDDLYLKIVGIIDSSSKLNEYNSFKTETLYDYNLKNDSKERKAYNELTDYLKSEENCIYVSNKFINKQNEKKNSFARFAGKISYNSYNAYPERMAYFENETIVYTDTGEKKIKDLADDEIVISDSTFNALTNYQFYSSYYNAFKEPYYAENNKNNAISYLTDYIKSNNVIGSKIKLNIKNGALSVDDYEEFKIAGIIMSEPISDYGINSMLAETKDTNTNENTVFCSKSVATPFITNNAQLLKMVTKISNKDNLKKILENYPAIDSKSISYSNYSNNVINTYIGAKELGEMLKYVIIVFAVFSAFVVVDFIQKSVKSSRKKIGTLRALGCSSIDVMKIFLSESCLMMVLPLIISIVVSPLIIEKINQFMINQGILPINMLSFAILNIIEIILFMVIIILVSNILLVGKATRMKPIDAILNK